MPCPSTARSLSTAHSPQSLVASVYGKLEISAQHHQPSQLLAHWVTASHVTSILIPHCISLPQLQVRAAVVLLLRPPHPAPAQPPDPGDLMMMMMMMMMMMTLQVVAHLAMLSLSCVMLSTPAPLLDTVVTTLDTRDRSAHWQRSFCNP